MKSWRIVARVSLGFLGARPVFSLGYAGGLCRPAGWKRSKPVAVSGGGGVAEALAGLRVPLLAIAGRQDRIIPWTLGGRVTQTVRGARLRVS